MKRFVALLMVLVLVVGVFVGCGKEEKDDRQGAEVRITAIAGPTGEGITSARSFTRKRRCVMVDSFRII